MYLVCGVGINDKKYKVSINGKHIAEYKCWKNMLERCYSSTKRGINPTYLECTVSENFKLYSYFHEWCQNQIGFGLDGWELDKDILKKGNKVYSEDTCVFLPKELNQAIVKADASRGQYLIGVSFDRRRGLFESCLRANGKKMFLGYFSDEISAHKKYKEEKEACIKNIATRWAGLIDPRAYNALMRYEVETTD